MSMTNAELRRHFDESLAVQTAAIHKELKEIKDKVDPMHSYFITAQNNMAMIKYLSKVGGGLVAIVTFLWGLWHTAKDFFK